MEYVIGVTIVVIAAGFIFYKKKANAAQKAKVDAKIDELQGWAKELEAKVKSLTHGR